MFLVIVDPFNNKNEQVLDPQGLPLGAFVEENVRKNIAACIINGRFHENWQSFIGGQNDRVEMLLKIGEPGSIIAGIVAAVVSAALSAIIRALTPQPKKPKQNSKRNESFGIAGFNNTTGAGTPKFVVFGENRVLGHVIGSGASLSPDGKEMFGRILYLMGDTGLDGYESITNVTLDETDASQFPEIQIETRLGTAGQSVIPYFENADQVFTDNRQLEFDRDTQTGTPIIYTTQSNTVNRATLFFQFTSGLYRVNAKGRERGAGVFIRVETKRNSEEFFSTYAEITYSEQFTSTLFKAFDIDFASGDKWDIKITKYGENGFSQGEPFFADVLLFNVQETTYTTRNYSGSALLAVINIPARKFKSLEMLRVAALVQGQKCKVWTGSNFVTQFTRKRCWQVRTMMTHALIGMGNEITEDEIDDDQWLESQNYYDELVLGHSGNEVRDLSDFVMNESQWDWEWIKSVAGEGRGRVIPSGDKWKYVIDKPGTPDLLYAEPGNIVEGSLIAEISQDDRPFNQVIAEFRDVTNDYKPDIAPPITDPDIGSDPIIQETRRYDTIIRESEIQRENMIILKREKLEKRKFMFTSPKGAIVSEPLGIDYLAERAIGDEGAYTGFLPAGSTQTNVVLPFPCELKPAEAYAIIIRHSDDNTVEYRNVSTTSGTWAQVAVSSAFTEAPTEGDLFALGIANLDFIPTRAQDLIIDNEGRVRQVRTEYIPAVYTADALPDKQSRRFFRLGDQPPPLPLRDAQVREEIVLNRDGSIRSILIFDVTPGLPKHGGNLQSGNASFVILDTFEPEIADYYVGAVIKIIAGAGAGQDRKIVDYETNRGAVPESPFNPADSPDSTSQYEIEWMRFGEFGGFRVEMRDDVTMNFAEIARAYGVHWEIDGRGAGPGSEEFRFTPFSLAGVENGNGRFVRTLTLVGDLSAPAAPAAIVLAAYLKTVTATVTLNRPMAEDFSSVEIEFWRDGFGGTLLQVARYGASPDSAPSGTMTIQASATFVNELYGTVIWARARSVDRSNNMSGFVESPAGVTLTLPPDFGPDLVPPNVPTGLTLMTGVQPDPVTGLPVVYLQGSWDANTETDISIYEFQYRQEGSASWTVRMVSHPEVSIRDLGVMGNVLHEAKVQAIDTAGNKSGFTALVSIVTAKDTTPPSRPTNLSVIDGFQQIVIRFIPPGDVDFSTIEVWRSQANDLGTATYIGDSKRGDISYIDANLPNDATFYYWLRSKDFSGNVSNFIPGATTGLEGHTIRIDGNDVVITQALITASAQISNAIINNAHISNLSADKLTAGVLQAVYTLGVGAGMTLDGVNRNIVVRDQNNRVRTQIGRLGGATTDYGLQIFGSDGSLWFSITEGLNTLGLSPNAASQLSSLWDWGGYTFSAGPGGRQVIGQLALITVGGPVVVSARYWALNTDIANAHHTLEIWRDYIGGAQPESLNYVALNDGAPNNVTGFGIDYPPAGYHVWYIVDYDHSGSGITPTFYNIKMQLLETKR